MGNNTGLSVSTFIIYRMVIFGNKLLPIIKPRVVEITTTHRGRKQEFYKNKKLPQYDYSYQFYVNRSDASFEPFKHLLKMV